VIAVNVLQQSIPLSTNCTHQQKLAFGLSVERRVQKICESPQTISHNMRLHFENVDSAECLYTEKNLEAGD